MASSISKPSLIINGDTAPIKPNSVKFVEGFGETQIRVQSNGGNSKEYVSDVNLETQTGSISATFLATSSNVSNKRTWQQLNGSLTVQWVDPESGDSRTLKSGTITEDPEVSTGMDGEFELKFEGAQLV
jgi:hypothetical protein